MQVGQQPPRRSGSQQLTLSAVEKGDAAANAMHFVDVILRGVGHHLRAPARGEEDLHSLQTQRFLPGGAKQVIPAEQMVSTLLVEEDWEIHRATSARRVAVHRSSWGRWSGPSRLSSFCFRAAAASFVVQFFKKGASPPPSPKDSVQLIQTRGDVTA